MKQYKLTQKVLKIGDSAGVTLPARQLKAMGVQPGDYVELTIKKHQLEMNDASVIKSAADLLDRYNQDFTNLAGR